MEMLGCLLSLIPELSRSVMNGRVRCLDVGCDTILGLCFACALPVFAFLLRVLCFCFGLCFPCVMPVVCLCRQVGKFVEYYMGWLILGNGEVFLSTAKALRILWENL